MRSKARRAKEVEKWNRVAVSFDKVQMYICTKNLDFEAFFV